VYLAIKYNGHVLKHTGRARRLRQAHSVSVVKPPAGMLVVLTSCVSKQAK